MPSITLTPEQQVAVDRFEDNVENTGDYGTSTLSSVFRAAVDDGDWLLFLEQLALTSEPVHTHVSRFFLALCGYTPETIWQETGSSEAAAEHIADLIDSDDTCPFRETSRYLSEFVALSAAQQQEVDELLRVVFPDVPLQETIQQTLLPAMEELQKRALCA